jgi:hypothetical protein
LRDGLLFQVERSTTGGVEVSVRPDQGLSHVLFVWRIAEMNLGSAGLTACATIQ